MLAARILLFVGILSVLEAEVCGQERIVGGKEVDIQKVPYQLSIRAKGMAFCGGGLIGPRHGLSAAHCFPVPASYSVRMGSSSIDSGGIIVGIRRVLLHPLRFSHKFQYDIAVLEFTEPVQFSTSIQPARLPYRGETLKEGTKGLISGFGSTQTNGDGLSPKLRATEVVVATPDQCRMDYSAYRVVINERVFCAGDSQGRKDSCQGDSGGPFVINNTLYGLVSYGMDCGDAKHPGVYTNVASYRDFIRINTGI